MGDSSLSRALAEAMVQARAMPQGDADERRTGMSLKDAKDVVDAYRERHPVPT